MMSASKRRAISIGAKRRWAEKRAQKAVVAHVEKQVASAHEENVISGFLPNLNNFGKLETITISTQFAEITIKPKG